MTGRTAPPGSGPARAAINHEETGPESPVRPSGRLERAGPGARARAGTGRESARPVPIRPAANRTHRLLLSGQLAHDTAPELEAALDELCEAGIGELVLDLGDLHAIDATGMRVIAMRCELCRRRGIVVRVERLQGSVLDAFTRAELLGRLPLAPSARAPGKAR